MTCPPEKSLSFTDALSKSYKLSYPVLAGDAGKALCVVIESMDEWKVDLTVQKRRKYYKPFSKKLRKKIILSKPVLLQYIVCRRTVKHEKSQETELLNGRGTLGERTLLLRFIKHMLQESFCQAFYVTIGICRVLHKYDHATTKLIYGVLDQRDQEMLVDDPNNKTDYEYRRWKMVLFDKLEQRFEKFVEVRSGARNEKRFVSHEQPAEVSDYVKKCLNLLTPWETEHILPEEFEPAKFNIAGLRLDGNYRDDWDPIEENRMHTIIDPECFSRLIKACNAPSSEQQLEAPKFKMVNQHPDDGDDSNVDIDDVPELTFAQTKTILDELEKKSKRRSEIYAEYLSVEVDGVHSGVIDTAADKNFCLELNPASEQIQVFAADKEDKLLLASLWLSFTGVVQGEEWKSSIVLEGGQKLGIELKPSLNADGELGAIVARISFQETNPLKILARYYQRIGRGIDAQLQTDKALNQIRLLQRAVYTHRSGFAMLLLFAIITLSLIVPHGNNRLSQTSAEKRNERVDIVERRKVDSPRSPIMNPDATETRTEEDDQFPLYKVPSLDTKHLERRRVDEPFDVEKKREPGAPSGSESEMIASNFNKPAEVKNWPGWKFGGEQPVKFFDGIRDRRWLFSGHLEIEFGTANRQTAEYLQTRNQFFAPLPFARTDLEKSVNLTALSIEAFRQASKHFEAALAGTNSVAPASPSGKTLHISSHFAFPDHRNDSRFVTATEKFSLAREMFLIGLSLPNAKQDNAVVQPDLLTQQLLSSIFPTRRTLWTVSSHDASQTGQREKSTATKPPVAESLTGATLRHRYKFGGGERFQMVFDFDVLNTFHDHIDPSLMTGSRANVMLIRTNGDNKNAFNISDVAEHKEATSKAGDCVPNLNTSCAPSRVRFGFRLLF